MKNVNVNEMVEVSIEDVISRSGYDISEWFEVFESGVYKVMYGSRGEIEEVELIEVKDGCFEVESKEELLEEFEIFVDGDSNKWKMVEEYKEELNEWFVVELDDGVLCVSRGEEDNDEYYKVEVV